MFVLLFMFLFSGFVREADVNKKDEEEIQECIC